MKSYRKRLLQVIAGMELLQETEWAGVLLFFCKTLFSMTKNENNYISFKSLDQKKMENIYSV